MSHRWQPNLVLGVFSGRVLLEAFVSAAFLGSDFLPFLLIVFLGLAVILLLN